MGTDFINIYTDDQSEIIIDEISDVISAGGNQYSNLGESPRTEFTYKNKLFRS